MKKFKNTKIPDYLLQRQNVKKIICYDNKNLVNKNFKILINSRKNLIYNSEIIIPPRDAKCFTVKKGNFFRIECMHGSQVGDLNIFNLNNLEEKFYSGKTRALHGTHLSTSDQLWSSFPYLRPLATITHDTLDWYGWDDDGGSVHDVIGTRCDPYTAKLLTNNDFDYCCHSNLIRALAGEMNFTPEKAEKYIHDVLNVFMCTGFTKDTHQYYMKASPVRRGDYLEFFAEIDLLGVLSSCPGGDCGTSHSSNEPKCHPLKVSIWSADIDDINDYIYSAPSNYKNNHGII